MPKKAARRGRRRVSTVALPPPPLIELGRTVEVTVKKASAEKIVLHLSDGSVLDLRPMVVSIERSVEKYNQAGDPIYQVNVALLVQPKVPRRLKRKSK